MNPDFPRILTLLRKEKGISQKQAASELKVSQALLSHYEKGIRECGLDFIVRTADFYNVSCDYLLGRSPDRNGATITVDEIPEPDAAGKDNVLKGGSILTTLNKKLITNSLNIIYDLASKTKNKKIISEMSSFLMLSVYRMFRILFSINTKNQQNLFTISKTTANSKAHAMMTLNESAMLAIVAGEDADNKLNISDDELTVSNEKLSSDYPLFASSLLNLVQNCENNLK